MGFEDGLVKGDETFVRLVTCLVHDVDVKEFALVLEEDVAVDRKSVV